MADKIVEVRDVSVQYNGVTVLDHVTFDVEKGDVLGIVGPNGGGKTTLLNAILGNVKLTSGSVRLFGVEQDVFRDFQRIGFVAQHAIQFDPLFPATVEEIVGLGCLSRQKMGRRLNKADREAATRAMETVGIEAIRKKRISELSGGQKQRIFLAKALVRDPDLLILDEATSGLDITIRDRFVELLKDLKKERGMTVISVSHDLSSIMCQANKLAVVNRRLEMTDVTEGVDATNALRQAYGEHFTFVFHNEREECVIDRPG
ncbi:MAG TPA: metal ABC transporter ATP-binding protein [Methanomassiliicoccales archaeon]|nr:metal ABC transporter ATP-binding protein [Methanomassiliicoccales archaeon]